MKYENFKIPIKIYDTNKYKEIINIHFYKDICGNYYETEKDNFFKDLLKLSDYNCFYCGESLLSNNEKGVFFEKEHIINKTINGTKNYALNRCAYNLIPICRTCNSKKKYIYLTTDLKKDLLALKKICESNKSKKNKNKPLKCNIDNCLEIFSNIYFNPFHKNLKFDLLSNRYEGEPQYIDIFSLNERSDFILDKLNESLYEITMTFYEDKNYLEYLKNLFPNTLERSYIDFLYNLKLISPSGTFNLKKLNNLIRTRMLLKEII